MFSCGGQKQKQLVIIFENPAPYEGKDEKLAQSAVYTYSKNQRVSFVAEDGVAYTFVATKPYDTLVITSSMNREVVELNHYYYRYMYFEDVLLQADDTVRIHYNDTSKPTYTSHNKENNRLYGLRSVLYKDFLGNDPEFIYELKTNYFLRYMRQKDAGVEFLSDNSPSDSLTELYYASLPEVWHAFDSLTSLGELSPAFESYYRYYLHRAELAPLFERQAGDLEFPLTPQQYAFFNDSLVNFISYRNYLAQSVLVFAKNGTDWKIPRIEAVNAYDSAVINVHDYRAVFDRIADMKQKGDNRISEISYDYMLYHCVDVITNFEKQHTKEDAALYLDKYMELTTRFLVEKEESASSFWGIPFRLLVFILQLNVCIAVFYSLYRLSLYNSMAFVACRIFLLSGIALSLAIAFGLVNTKMFIPENLLEVGQWVKPVGWFVVGLYMLFALFLLYKVVKQLVYIWTLRHDSWRIKDGSYILHILKDIVTSPSAFFRMIFISWGDFFSDRDKRNRLLVHEAYHVKRLHSIDATVLMLMRCLCWFNPFFNMYARELKLVNEYAADRAVIREMGIRIYMRAIVDDVQQQEAYNLLSNSFAGRKDMEKRIKMIRRYDSVSYGIVPRFLLIVPVFLVLMHFSPEFIVRYCSLPEVLTTLL